MEVRKPIFEIAPEALDGIEFRGVGRKEEQRDVGGKVQRPRFVKRPIIEEEEVEAGRISSGKMVEKELKALRIKGW